MNLQRIAWWSVRLAALMSLASAAVAQPAAGAPAGFELTRPRGEYLRMPISELTPMLSWLEDLSTRPVGLGIVARGDSELLLIHCLLVQGRPEQALSVIAAARNEVNKPQQRDATFVDEELLARARAEGWNEARFVEVANQRMRALPWPAARSRLLDLTHALDIAPFETTAVAADRADLTFQAIAQRSQVDAAINVVEARYLQEVLQPHVESLRSAIQVLLAAHAGEPGYWEQRAMPPLKGSEHPVAVAVWDPDGVDLTLFRHPETDCLVLASGDGCLVDPEIAGANHAQAWELVRGFQDGIAGLATAPARAWQEREALLIGERQRAVSQDRPMEIRVVDLRRGSLTTEVVRAGSRMHGTHVAGIVVEGNPDVELLAIRDGGIVEHPGLEERQWRRRFDRIERFLRTNHVRIVNMSWGVNARVAPTQSALFESHMLTLMAALPETLFVAGAGNDDRSIERDRFVPASLSAANFLTVGAVDQDGQVTYFSNTGSGVALYANGDRVTSLAPGGYPLEMSGTSMAAPQVCNVAARLLRDHPELSVAELKRLLLDAADERPAGNQLDTPVRVLNPARSLALASR